MSCEHHTRLLRTEFGFCRSGGLLEQLSHLCGPSHICVQSVSPSLRPRLSIVLRPSTPLLSCLCFQLHRARVCPFFYVVDTLISASYCAVDILPLATLASTCPSTGAFGKSFLTSPPWLLYVHHSVLSCSSHHVF